jgi:hypothetical protein
MAAKFEISKDRAEKVNVGTQRVRHHQRPAASKKALFDQSGHRGIKRQPPTRWSTTELLAADPHRGADAVKAMAVEAITAVTMASLIRGLR